MSSEMKARIADVINRHKFTHDECPLARLILEAMREPTEAMTEAGVNAAASVRPEGVPLVWRAMIDEALKGASGESP